MRGVYAMKCGLQLKINKHRKTHKQIQHKKMAVQRLKQRGAESKMYSSLK